MRTTTSAAVVAAVLAVAGSMGASPASAAEYDKYCYTNVTSNVSFCRATQAEYELAVARQPRAASYLLAVMYDAHGFDEGDGVWRVFANGSGCDAAADMDWEIGWVGSSWNDRISSFQGHSRCQVRLFEDINFGGSSTPKSSAMSFVGGAMNDEASSIRFF